MNKINSHKPKVNSNHRIEASIVKSSSKKDPKTIDDIERYNLLENKVIENSEEIYDLYENAPCGYHSLGSDGSFLKMNTTELKWLGYTLDEVIGKKTAFDILTHGSRKKFKILFPILKKHGFLNNIEFEFQRKDGTTFPVLLNATLVKDTKGNFLMSRSTIFDITERKMAENDMKEKVEDMRRLATVISDSNDAVIMHNLDGKILAWNRGAKETYGYTETEALKMNVRDIVAEPDREAALDLIQRIKIGEIVKSFELRRVTKDGRILDVWLTTTLLTDDKGNPVAIATTERDISERNKADTALKVKLEDMRRLATVVSDSNDAVILHDFDGKILAWNRGAIENYGFTEAEALKKNVRDIVAEPDREAALVLIHRIKSGEIVKSFELRRVTKDGRILDVWLTTTLLTDEMGKPIAIATTERDITERKHTEQENRQIKELFQTIFEKVPLGIALIDSLSGHIYESNTRFTIIIGRNRDEMKNIDWMSITHPDDVQEDLDNMAKLNAGAIAGFKMNKRFLRKDGSVIWISMVIAPIPIEINMHPRHLCMIDDITERKMAETALKEKLEDMRRLATVISDSNDAVILHDFDGKILAWNRGAIETYGYTEAEALKKNVRDIVAKPDRKAALDLIQRIKKGEIVKSFELRRVAKDGRILYVWLTTTLLTDEKGKPVAIATTERDMTERKQAEIAIKEKMEDLRRMATVVSDSNDAVILHDLDGKILAWNRGAIETYGYTEAEALKKNVRDIVAEPDRKAAVDLIQRIKQGEVVKSFELRRVAKDGRIIDVWLTTTLLTDEKGNPVAIATTERDIIERKQAEDNRIAKDSAESANRMKSQFLANMSHEIRTPMNAILGYSELLGFVMEDSEQKNYLESIKSSGRGLLTLINDILDLSKIEAGKIELQLEFVDSFFFFSEFKQIFSLKILERGLEFILDISSDIPAGIYVDEARLRQVLFNLIGNASKFTESGYVKLKVFTENPHVHIIDCKNEDFIDLIIEVEDTGIGIPKKFQEEIFQPFVQQMNQSTKKYGGTGLGLAITLRLVELMNGSIQLQSAPNEGSTFRVSIPDVKYLRDFKKSKKRVQIDPTQILFEKANILIVDDVAHNRSYLKDALKNSKLTVFEAENGQEAFKMATEIVPDLIITDIHMPVMDGFELLEKIKADNSLIHVPVIAYSASVMKEQGERIFKSKFAGLLIKPVQITELYMELIKLLPYKVKKAKVISTSESEIAQLKLIKDLPELIHLLKTQYNEIWKSFELRQPVGEIRKFGKQLIALGEEHTASLITKYGIDLLIATDSFDIENILKLIKRYPELIEKLQISTITKKNKK